MYINIHTIQAIHMIFYAFMISPCTDLDRLEVSRRLRLPDLRTVGTHR